MVAMFIQDCLCSLNDNKYEYLSKVTEVKPDLESLLTIQAVIKSSSTFKLSYKQFLPQLSFTE